MFKLHKKLLKTTHSVAELNLCTARLMDNAKFPWLILIPKRKNVRQILDLNKKDQIKLMEEIDSFRNCKGFLFRLIITKNF